MDASSDAPPPQCDLSKPFASIIEVKELNTSYHEGMLRLTPDGLTGYFQRFNQTTFWDLYTATRTELGAPFTGQMPLNSLNTADDEGAPFPSNNDLTLNFTRLVRSNTTYDIEIATRKTKVDIFSNAMAAGFPPQSFDAYLANDEATYFVGRPSIDILRKVGASIDVMLEGPDNELWPAVTSDELTLYFSMGGSGVDTGMDVLVAKRASKSNKFTTRSLVTELNTGQDEFPTYVSPDGCVLYFSSTRNGSLDIFVARKP
jgi:hypothetical protein